MTSLASIVGFGEVRLGIDKLNPISFGLLACNYLMIYVYRAKILGEKIKYIKIRMSCGLIGLLLSGSKSTFIAFVFVYALISIVTIKANNKRKLSVKKLLNTGLIVGFVYLVFMRSGWNPFARFMRMFADTETSTLSRYASYLESIIIWTNSPLIGSSVLLERGGYPHSVFFDVLTSLGLVGLLAFLIVIKVTWTSFKKNSFAKSEFGIISCWFYCTLVVSLFSGAIHANSTLFVLGAVSMAGMQKRWF